LPLTPHQSAIYGRVTEEDIDNYKVKYRFCDAEKEDLLEFYSNYGGDLTNILEFIPYSDEDDVERYACWFSLQIQAETLKSTKKFKPWLRTDVNAEQQEQLWEQGKFKLEKAPPPAPDSDDSQKPLFDDTHQGIQETQGF
jgi:DnaJ family protein C protein 9